ncbi:hypothetical protein [Paenarthrobacter nitroguajacolicus]|uniref:hypothetical protein n=1 Tax=Paenarthrobacter nitroguajacolicus TaxID=211146 RepID=UPI003AF33268
MSKSLAADALLAAVDGGHVAIFAETATAERVLFEDFMRAYPELGVVAEIIRALGREALTFPGGGTLTFLSQSMNLNRLRGWSLDRCYVPIGTRRQFVDDHLRPCLAASKDGTLAGY